MRAAVDVMGGDKAPGAILKGCWEAAPLLGPEDVVLLIGNEQQGLPADYETECDLLVKIPMAGRADSLNAAIAAGVMAFAIQAKWR